MPLDMNPEPGSLIEVKDIPVGQCFRMPKGRNVFMRIAFAKFDSTSNTMFKEHAKGRTFFVGPRGTISSLFYKTTVMACSLEEYIHCLSGDTPLHIQKSNRVKEKLENPVEDIYEDYSQTVN